MCFSIFNCRSWLIVVFAHVFCLHIFSVVSKIFCHKRMTYFGRQYFTGKLSTTTSSKMVPWKSDSPDGICLLELLKSGDIPTTMTARDVVA